MDTERLDQVAAAICRDEGYELAGLLGAGSFKRTYRIRRQDGNLFALKVFLPGLPAPRIERELSAMAQCRHPSIARLHSVSETQLGTDTYAFCLEEFIPGGTLSDRLRARGLLTAEEALALGVSLIDALAHIASHQLVHRDLKPDNILLREDGMTPVITDFGVVRDLASTSLTPTWSMRGPGTPLFSSPEQLNNQKALIDWRSDQFSLGVVLAICALGVHPMAIPEANASEIVDRIADHTPATAEFEATVTGRGLPALVRMVAPWPVQRFRTPRLLAERWARQEGRR